MMVSITDFKLKNQFFSTWLSIMPNFFFGTLPSGRGMEAQKHRAKRCQRGQWRSWACCKLDHT